MKLEYFIVVLSLSIQTTLSTQKYQEKDKPCHFSETVNITSGTKKENGDIEFDNFVYNTKIYAEYDYEMINRTHMIEAENHLRGCKCKVTNCVRFCNETSPYIDLSFTNKPSELIDLKKQDFHIVRGQPCPNLIDYAPENGDIEFFENGSIFWDNNLLSHNDYCLNLNENDNKTTTALYICYESDEPDIKQRLYPIGMMISLVFLVVTFSIYAICPELQTLHGKNLMCYVFSLIMMYLSLSMVYLVDSPSSMLCKTEGYMVYFSALSCFFWLNILCFEICTTIRGSIHHKRGRSNKKLHFSLFFLYAFGIPLILTVFVYSIDNNDYVGSLIPSEYHPTIGIQIKGHPTECFLTSQKKFVQLIYFYSITFVIMTINAIFFVATSDVIQKVRKETKTVVSDSSCSDTKRYTLNLRLFILMGVFWIMEPISWFFSDIQVLFYITDLVNSLQGLIIFMMFVLKQKVWKALKKRCGCGALEPRQNTMKTSRFSLSRTISTKL